MVVFRSRAHRLYASLFQILILCWPFWVIHVPWLLGTLLFVNTGVYVTIVRYTGSKDLTFSQGLCALAASYESGYINITFLYIPFVLTYYYLLMILATFDGIRNRRSRTQNWWIQTVRGRFASDQEYEANILPPKWFS